MDQFAVCWHIHLYLCIHQTTGSWVEAAVFFSLLGWRIRFGSFQLFPPHHLNASDRIFTQHKMSSRWGKFGNSGKLGNWCVYKIVGSESSRKSKTNISAGFHLSDIMFKCSFKPVPVFKGKKEKKKGLTVPAASSCSASSTALWNRWKTRAKLRRKCWDRPLSHQPLVWLRRTRSIQRSWEERKQDVRTGGRGHQRAWSLFSCCGHVCKARMLMCLWCTLSAV